MQKQVLENKSEIPINKKGETHIFEILMKIGNEIPDEELNKLPKDLSENFEHYMYGAPKQDDSIY